MGWMVFEIIINFLEMLTSCFLAKKMFQNTNKEKKNNVMFFVFAVVGTVLLTIREHNIVEIPDLGYYYILDEFVEDGSGTRTKTGRLYAVEVYTGAPNRLIYHENGEMGLISLTDTKS